MLLKKLLSLLYHPDKKARSIITLSYILIGLITNFFLLQVFCVPVWWAGIAVGFYFLAIVLLPLLRNPLLRAVAYFIVGAGIPISLYCLWFLEFPFSYLVFLFAILFFGLGLIAFLPFYLLYHTFRYFKEGTKTEKMLLAAGCLFPLICFGNYWQTNKVTYDQLELIVEKEKDFPEDFAKKLPATHITERVLGIGFKYHTSLDFIYDGWRPPLHDPFLNAFIRLYAKTDYPFTQISLENRIRYYQYLFPEKPVQVSCPCSYSDDGRTYLTNFSRLISRPHR